jgi:hypothetical protein
LNGEGRLVQGILTEALYAGGREFAHMSCEDESRLLEVTRLDENLNTLKFTERAPLSTLNSLRAGLEELIQLRKRIEAAAEVHAALKQTYAGEQTDLVATSQASAYIEYIEGAVLPEALRNSLLTAHGPQRLQDTRTMVMSARNGLTSVKDHLARLNQATHGQSKDLEELPLIDLVQKIQLALKEPRLR